MKSKGRRESGSFIAIPHDILEHENYAALSARAVKLLIDMYSQYKGHNNGDFSAAFKLMKKKGWTSKDQLWKARIELEQRGWITLTRLGGRNKAHLFAVTFKPIDECKGKLDVAPTRVALGYWKLGYNPELMTLTRATG